MWESRALRQRRLVQARFVPGDLRAGTKQDLVQRIKSAKIGTILLAMLVALVGSALFQLITFRHTRQMGRIGRQDAHVRDVLAALTALRSATQEAVICQSGYLLGGDVRDLQSYQHAAAVARERLARVRALTADDATQAEDARALDRVTERQLDDLKNGLDRSRADAKPDADLTEQVRRTLDRMTDRAQQVRAACIAQTQAASSAQARWLIAASVYRVFVLLAGCTLILRQQARQRRSEHLRRQSEEFFRNAFDHAATGMALADPQGRWLKVNRALCELLGYAQEELLHGASPSIHHPEDLEKERTAVQELIEGRVVRCRLEKRYVHKSGHTVWALVTQSLVRDERGRPQTFISQIQDITDRKHAEDRLRHQSLHDALTGLPNRQLLNDAIQRAIARANQDPDYRLAVLFLDLDRFKQINDSLGHAAGDELLTSVARRLRHCVRGSDALADNGPAPVTPPLSPEGGGDGHTVARLAGDEFTVLLKGLRAPGDAERVAERILRELDKPIEFAGQSIRTGASIGIVYADGLRYTSARQLLADADAALYQAKAAGRGRYALFTPDPQPSATTPLRRIGPSACEDRAPSRRAG